MGFWFGKVGWVSCCQPTPQHLGADAPAGQGGLGVAPTAFCLPKHHLSPFHQLPKALSCSLQSSFAIYLTPFKSKVSSLLLHPLNLPTLFLTIEHLLHSAFFLLHPYPVSFKALRYGNFNISYPVIAISRKHVGRINVILKNPLWICKSAWENVQ